MTKTHCFTSKKDKTKYNFYHTFINIRSRCNNKNKPDYKNYGWRWIKCEWENFEEFKDDMRESFIQHTNIYWRNNTTIDRIDNNGNYCKENCKRATREEQGNNKRCNRISIIDWKEYRRVDLVRMLGISASAAGARIIAYNEWRMTKEKVFSKEKLKQDRKKYNVNWERYDVYRLMKECDLTIVTAENRLREYNAWKIPLSILFHKWKVEDKRYFRAAHKNEP